MRFAVQWIASERAGRSIVPTAFWVFSIGGGLLLLIYALHRRDPVFIAGQGLGVFIYLRNLQFVMRERKARMAANWTTPLAKAANPRSKSAISVLDIFRPDVKADGQSAWCHLVAERMVVQSNGIARLS